MWKKKSSYRLQRKKEKVKFPMSLRENSVCLVQKGVSVNWQQRKLAIAGVLCWKVITGRSISEFKNYLTVNYGLHDVAKKFGIQKFTVEISTHRCKKPGRRNRRFSLVECSHVRSHGFLQSSLRFSSNNKQSTLRRYLCARMSKF